MLSEPIHAEEECSLGDTHEVTLNVCRACIHLCGVNPYLDATWRNCRLMYWTASRRVYSPTAIALAQHKDISEELRRKWLEESQL